MRVIIVLPQGFIYGKDEEKSVLLSYRIVPIVPKRRQVIRLQKVESLTWRIKRKGFIFNLHCMFICYLLWFALCNAYLLYLWFFKSRKFHC